MADMTHDTSQEDDIFPQDASGLPEARATSVVSLADGDVFPLSIGPVGKTIEGARLRMLAYNGSIPGPLLRVKQGTTVTVDVTNDAGLDQTVHWHGLRLDNRFDGVPYDTQQPIPTGGRYSCELKFPDPGLYWYHPHIREDYAQEMGLYGQIIVDPTNPDYWPPANRDIALTLDDLLLQDGQLPAFHRSGPTHTMMGRFGTILLVNGEQDPSFAVSRGEVVRLYLTNTANTRVFNLAITGATLKLIGGDSGRYEREELVDSILLSPQSARSSLSSLISPPPGSLSTVRRMTRRGSPRSPWSTPPLRRRWQIRTAGYEPTQSSKLNAPRFPLIATALLTRLCSSSAKWT
jgi:FtsP/CotA-like multicopper oxidase with cupredoxin domain